MGKMSRLLFQSLSYQARFKEVLHKEANMNCKETPSNWQMETKSDCNRIL